MNYRLQALIMLALGVVVAGQLPFTTVPGQTWSMEQQTVSGNEHVSMTGSCQDLAGNIFVVGYVNGDFEHHSTLGESAGVVQKFTKQGQREWIRFIDSLNRDEAHHCAVDTAGGVVVSGRTWGILSTFNQDKLSPGASDGFVARYDSTGGLLWNRILLVDGMTGDSYPSSVAVDADNNVRVALACRTATYYYSYKAPLFMIFANGTEGWQREFAVNQNVYLNDNSGRAFYIGPNPIGLSWTTEDYTQNLDCDAFGVCYIVVNSNQVLSTTIGDAPKGSWDSYVYRISSNGTVEWIRAITSTGSEFASSLRIDATGNPVIGGRTSGSLDGEHSSGTYDCFVVQLDPQGNRRFTRVFGSRQQQRVVRMATDSQGAIYLLIQQLNSGSSNHNTDFFDGVDQILPFNSQMFGLFTMMDAFGNRVFTYPLSAGQAVASSNTGYLNLFPLGVSVSPDGTSYTLTGKVQGVFNQASHPFPSFANTPQGFILSAQIAQSCNTADFDNVMTEINDLLHTLEA